VPELITERSGIRSEEAGGGLPLFFCSAGRPLYGAFHPASGGLSKAEVLVFCHSIGIEHMVTQRMEVLGAMAATKLGFAAFRYNSRGHGDSAGDPRDVTFGDLVDDACAAADYARELSGARRIIWVGVRFGCLVAAEAILRRDTAALALWEPLHRGDDYFRAAIRSLLFSQVADGKRPGVTADYLLKQLESGGVLPIVGTYLYHALYRSARQTELARSLKDWGGDTMIAQVQHGTALSAGNERLCAQIQQLGGKVTVALISQEPAWSMLPLSRPQWTNESLLAATKEWLHGLE
jgi:pimeloyl-ACP methyl ester carboxylesterase